MEDQKNEKLPFIGKQIPVTLNPSWESKMVQDANGKGSLMSKTGGPFITPRDKYLLVFFIFVLHGLGTLMPWNMFITAKSYFEDFKLASNATNVTISDDPPYALKFMPYVGFASQIPNLLFNWLNVFVNFGGDLTKRIVYSILVEIVVFIVTIVLAMLDSSSWTGVFFWSTMVSVVILNMANGIYQNTIYGMVAALPIKYTGAVVLGSNISGLFTSVISLLSIYLFDSKRTAAIYYFVTAMLILLLCFDTYFALPLNKFFRYYDQQNQDKSNTKKDVETPTKVPYWKIFKKASPQLFNIFMTFFVTLSVFPTVHSDIKRTDEDFFISKDYFTGITCFLTFNLFAMLGSLTTSWIKWPSPKYLVFPVLLRVAFIPLFIFCNYSPDKIIRTLPVYIHSEWIYWGIAIIMSFSSGYLSSLGMMYAPQTVTSKHQITAGMYAAAMLITGIFSGVMFSFLCPLIIQL